MLEFAKRIVVAAGKKQARAFHHELGKIQYKGKFHPVTKLDVDTEKVLINAIRKKFPTHGIVGEEGTDRPAKNGYTWIVDPLDGTVNFIRGFPYFTIAVGVMKNGRPYMGVIYNPATKELFYAQQGKGAYLNGKRLRVSQTKKLNQSYISTGFRYNRGRGFKRNVRQFQKVLENTLVVRRIGSASMDLCNVARGTFDAFFMYDAKMWDVVAGLVIVKEARGSCSFTEKKDHDVDIIAGNPHIVMQLKKLLRWK